MSRRAAPARPGGPHPVHRPWRGVFVLVALLLAPAPLLGQQDAETDTTATAGAPPSGTTAGSDGAGMSGAQESPGDDAGFWGFFDPDVSGQANLSTELYTAGSIDPRRPSAIWRLNSGARTNLFGGMSLNVDLIFSDEGVDFRQNVNQLGINPTWDWGGLYAGDFTLDYQGYVVRGSRVRGGGVLYDPGSWRASVQAGRLEREESLSGDDHRNYNRTMVAFKTGIGSERDTHLNLTVLRAWDALADGGIVRPDTLLLDTIPVDLRPEVEDRPQENWAVGVDGQLSLLDDRLTLDAEASASLITRDREASLVSETGAIPGDGPGEAVSDLADIRISTALDYAVNTGASYRLPFGTVDGSFEYVGPGFGTLGVPYLLNDRRNWDLGGSFRLFRGRLALQTRYLNQANNLTSQRRNTVNRNTVQAAIIARPLRAISVNVSGVYNTMVNDATSEVDRLDNQAVAVNTGVSWRHRLFGIRSSFGVEYGYQETRSRDTWIGASRVWTHRVSGSYRVRLTREISLAPKVSVVVTRGTGLPERQNTRLGFNGRARFLDGRLRTSASVSNTTSRGRDAFSARARASYPIVWGTELSLQIRHQRYSALGRRPAFNESFFTFGLSRSF